MGARERVVPVTASVRPQWVFYSAMLSLLAPACINIIHTYFRPAGMPSSVFLAIGTPGLGMVYVALVVVGVLALIVSAAGMLRFGSKGLLLFWLVALLVNGNFAASPLALRSFTAKVSARQATYAPSRPAPVIPVATQSPSSNPPLAIDYGRLQPGDFDPLRQEINGLMRKAQGEDLLVLRAFTAFLDRLQEAASKARDAQKAFADADVLNANTLTDPRVQCAERRQLANRVNLAFNELQNQLSSATGVYAQCFSSLNVPADRSTAEVERLRAQGGNVLSQWIQLCAAERELAKKYNYAIGALEVKLQTHLPAHERDFQEKLRAVEAARNTVRTLRDSAS